MIKLNIDSTLLRRNDITGEDAARQLSQLSGLNIEVQVMERVVGDMTFYATDEGTDKIIMMMWNDWIDDGGRHAK